MKTKLITRVGGIACVLATVATPILAQGVRNSISGSSINLGLHPTTGQPLGSVLHTTSIPTKKDGTKLTDQASTGITNSLLGESSSGPVNCNGALGLRFPYIFSYGVNTRQNGDLIVFALDPEKDSRICAFPTHFEATVHQTITGGTGEFAGACGWLKTTVSGVFTGPSDETTLSVFEGTSKGKVYVGDECL